jgi:Ca-activated chloride channel family protein
VLRSIVALLLILALAGLRLPTAPRTLAVVFALDLSDAIAPEGQETGKAWIRTALRHMGPDDLGGIVLFAKEARVEQALSKQQTHLVWGPVGETSATNIAAAVRTAAAMFPPGAARRIVLLSDGNETRGHVLQVLSEIPPGTQISVVPLPSREDGPDVVIEQVRMPPALRESEPFDIELTLRQRRTTMSARVRLWLDTQLIAEQQLTQVQGNYSLVFRHPGLLPGFHTLRAEAISTGASMQSTDTAWAFTVVKGKPVVVLVTRHPADVAPLQAILQHSQIQVETASPEQVPDDPQRLSYFQAVVMVDTPVGSDGLDSSRLQALSEYVGTLGGGLVVLGGRTSYGVGGYQGTVLERMLPVTMWPPSKENTRSIALVLVIDKSGSMDMASETSPFRPRSGGQRAGDTKMALVREAAMRTVDALHESDQIGVIAFDDLPEWVSPLIPAGSKEMRTRIKARVARIEAGGGTNIYKALELALDALLRTQARQKYIFLMTDGVDNNPNQPFSQLIQRIRDAQISLSTLAIGEDADRNLLRQWAEIAGGRAYYAAQPSEIPQAVLTEVRQVMQSLLVEQPIYPEVHDRSAVLRGLDSGNLPPLQGYVRTRPKNTAEVPLVTQFGDPLLAHWQYGLGRVAAWLSDAGTTWAGAWLERPDIQQFWPQLHRWTMPLPIERSLQVATTIDGDDLLISVEALAPDGSFRNLLPTKARIVTPSAQEIEVALPQTAPGRYQARVKAPESGPYQLTVEQYESTSPAILLASETTGFVIPHPAEHAPLGTNERLLRRLAEETGERVLRAPAEAFSHTEFITREPEEIWPALLTGAVVLFLVDVTLRRLRAAAVAASWLRIPLAKQRPAWLLQIWHHLPFHQNGRSLMKLGGQR